MRQERNIRQNNILTKQFKNNCVTDTEMRDIMGKSVYIAEKPSVAQEFAKALHVNFTRKDGIS